MFPSPTIWTVDANVNIDIDYATNVDINSNGILTGITSVSPSNGIATFSDLTHTAEGIGLTLTASSGILIDADSSPFDVTDVVIFEKINSLAELTDGEYIIINKNEGFAMNSAHDGSLFPATAVTPVEDQLEDPIEAIIWIISTDGSSRTIQSKNTNEYASYTGSSNNIQSVASVTTDNQRWDFAFSTNEFRVTNAAVTNRTLRYNPSSPRFVCYSSSFGDNLFLYKKAGGPVTYTFNGNWSPSNPNDGLSTASDNLIIVSGNAIINNNTTSNSVTVNAGASLTVNSEVTLAVNAAEGMVLNSTSTNYSSLILDGTIAGTVKYNRYVNSTDPINGNDLISAPLSGQAFNTFIANNPNIRTNPSGPEVLFGGFDNDSSTDPFELWNENDTTPLTAGKGYRSGITEGEPSNLVTFEGSINTSLVQIAIDQGSASKLNLIGNPFPSYLDAQQFLTHNMDLLDPSAAVIYGYNDSTDGASAGDYTIISALLNPGLNIAPGQGFFVASNASGGNIEFTTSTPDMRMAIGGDDFITGRNATVISNLKLNLSNSTDNFITDIFFTENSAQGLDPGYDASLLGGSTPSFALYSHLVQDNTGIPFAVQALSSTDYTDVTVSLGVNANQGQQLTFSISESNLPSSVEIYLDDTVANTSTLLNTGNYILTPNTDLNGTGRFYLRFTQSSLSTLNHSLDKLSIYTNKSDKTIVVAGQLIEATTVKLYDIQGRLVNTIFLDNKTRLQTIDVSNLNAGIYVVQLENGLQNKTQKVAIH